MIVQIQPAMFFINPYRQAILGQWVRSLNGLVWHHGVVTGFWLNPATNIWNILVTHTIPNQGVIVTTLDSFCEGRPVEIVAEPLSSAHQQLIVQTAQSNVGKPYVLFSQNCEHFASFCYLQKAESRQLQGAFAVAGLVAVAALAMNSTVRS